MKEIKLTCPFTGGEFTALESADGKLLVKHALTGEDIVLNWNCSIQRYNVEKCAFRHYETMLPVEAAKLLGVSMSRISQIMDNQVVPVHVVNGQKVFLREDVVKYKANRVVGRPKKVN